MFLDRIQFDDDVVGIVDLIYLRIFHLILLS